MVQVLGLSKAGSFLNLKIYVIKIEFGEIMIGRVPPIGIRYRQNQKRNIFARSVETMDKLEYSK